MVRKDDKINIIAEGESDLPLLKAFLESSSKHPSSSRYNYYAADGMSSALSLARSLLTQTDEFIVLVLHIESADAEFSDKKMKSFISTYLSTNVYDNLEVVYTRPLRDIFFSHVKNWPQAVSSKSVNVKNWYAPKHYVDDFSVKNKLEFSKGKNVASNQYTLNWDALIELFSKKDFRDEVMKEPEIKTIWNYTHFINPSNKNALQ